MAPRGCWCTNPWHPDSRRHWCRWPPVHPRRLADAPLPIGIELVRDGLARGAGWLLVPDERTDDVVRPQVLLDCPVDAEAFSADHFGPLFTASVGDDDELLACIVVVASISPPASSLPTLDERRHGASSRRTGHHQRHHHSLRPPGGVAAGG